MGLVLGKGHLVQGCKILCANGGALEFLDDLLTIVCVENFNNQSIIVMQIESRKL